MKPVYKSLLIAAALGAAGFGALAQMGPKGDHPEMMHMGSMHHGDPAKMAERINSHLSALKNKLHITASQEGAWSTFTSAMQPPAKMTALRPDRAEQDKLTTPERIEKMKQLRLDERGQVFSASDQVAFHKNHWKCGPAGPHFQCVAFVPSVEVAAKLQIGVGDTRRIKRCTGAFGHGVHRHSNDNHRMRRNSRLHFLHDRMVVGFHFMANGGVNVGF